VLKVCWCLPLLELLVLLMLFDTGGDIGVLFGEDAGNLDISIVVDHDRFILAEFEDIAQIKFVWFTLDAVNERSV